MVSDEVTRLEFIRNILSNKQKVVTIDNIQLSVKEMDDAALVKLSDSESLVVTSDFVRGSSFYLFKLGYLNYFDIGYYLIVANLSDIAAMGAKPFGLTTIIRYTDLMTDEQFQNVFEGMKLATDTYDVQIIGGDIGGHVSDVFAATAIGLIRTENALLRENVKDGDFLCVTGTIGLPITALIYFKDTRVKGFSFSPNEEEKILSSWKRPTARVEEGLILSSNKIANACQDISDGLKATIEQMSSLSGKNFTIYANKLPIDETTRKMAAFLDVDPIQIAVSASVDFELMFTMPKDKESICTELFRQSGLQYFIIGEVNLCNKNILVAEDGSQKELIGVSWKQQTGDFLQEVVKKA